MKSIYIVILSGLTVILTVCDAFSQSAAQPEEIQAVYACKSLTDSTARLDCYDNAVGRLEAAENSGEIVTVSKTEVEKVKRDAFGFNIPSIPGLGKLFKKDKSKKTAILTTDNLASIRKDGDEVSSADIKSVTLEIKKTTEFGYGKTRFFLSNGQVWEQSKAEKIRITKTRNEIPNTVVISKASLGSFLLRVNGKGKATRVRRVR